MHAQALMQRATHKSPFVRLAPPDAVDAFDPTSGQECCTADNFLYDMFSRPSSPWNRSVARVFAKSFREQHPDFQMSEKEVMEAWQKHTETLRRQFKDLEKADAEARYDRSRHRQQERKRQVRVYSGPQASWFTHPSDQLFSRRRAVTIKYLTQADTDLIDALGVHGMSSDESDHEAGRGEPTYIIRPKQWCSPELQAWLRTLDSLHLCMRYKTQFDASQGSWPHYRVVGRKASIRSPIQGLPINCYSTSLLSAYDDFRMTWLRPMVNTHANLAHTTEVIG